MKGRTLIWLWLMAVALVGCYTSTPSEEMCPEASPHSELANIDTLRQCYPDSALAMLLDTSFDEPYYQLLLSEALYKNDYQQANRQKLLVSMAYYDSVLARTQAPSAAFGFLEHQIKQGQSKDIVLRADSKHTVLHPIPS